MSTAVLIALGEPDASGGRAPPEPDTAQRAWERHEGRRPPPGATRAARPAGRRQGGRACLAVHHPARQGRARTARRSPPSQRRARKDARGRLCRIRAEVRADQHRGSGNAQVSSTKRRRRAPLKGFECGFESHRGHPRKQALPATMQLANDLDLSGGFRLRPVVAGRLRRIRAKVSRRSDRVLDQ